MPQSQVFTVTENVVCGLALATIGMAFYIGTVPQFDERPTMGLLIYVGVVTALWSVYVAVAALRYLWRLRELSIRIRVVCIYIRTRYERPSPAKR